MTAKAITAGSSGIAGALLAWLGFRREVSKIQQDIREMHKNVRYSVTCEAINNALKERLDGIEDIQKEMRADIKGLLKK